MRINSLEPTIKAIPFVNPFLKINFELFQTEFADDNLKLYLNGRKFSKSVEDTVEKGEIALYDFSFSHSVFKRLLVQTQTRVCLGKG